MYSNVLVPLDGSPMAERVLDYVKPMSRPNATLHLLSVVEPNMYAYSLASPEPVIQEKLKTVVHDDLQGYMGGVGASLRNQGYNAQIWVGRGEAAQTIADVGAKLGVDLIAMTTHGRSGFARWALGSVADRVLHIAHQPILLARIHQEAASPYTLRRILLPLDGSPLAEEALPHAEAIAQQNQAALIALRVIPPLSQWHQTFLAQAGYSESALADERQAAAMVYLEQIQTRLNAQKIVNETRLFVGDPSQAILDLVSNETMDLVVMSTHGLVGYSRWVYGSTAGKILHSAGCPLLVLRSVDVKASAAEVKG